MTPAHSSTPQRKDAAVLLTSFAVVVAVLAAGRASNLQTMPDAAGNAALVLAHALAEALGSALAMASGLVALALPALAPSRRGVASWAAVVVLACALTQGYLLPHVMRSSSQAIADSRNESDRAAGRAPTHVGLYPTEPATWWTHELAIHAVTGSHPGTTLRDDRRESALVAWWFRLGAVMACAAPLVAVIACRPRRWPWWGVTPAVLAAIVASFALSSLVLPAIRDFGSQGWMVLLLGVPHLLLATGIAIAGRRQA